jgi:hypothetical protein
VHTPRAGRYWNLGVTDDVQKRGAGLLKGFDRSEYHDAD